MIKNRGGPKRLSSPLRLSPFAPLALALVLLACSCGYNLVRESGVELPAGVESISVPLARNLTIEAGLEDRFTKTLIERLAADGRVDIGRDSPDQLRCRVTDLTVTASSYSAEGRIATQTARVKAECSLHVGGSGSVAWTTGPLEASEEYPVGNDYILNEEAKERAIGEALAYLAETVRSLLLDSF